MGLSPDWQYMLFRALRVTGPQRGAWASKRFKFDHGCRAFLVFTATTSSLSQRIVYGKGGYSAVFCFSFFKVQILKFACQFISRTLWTHSPLALLSVLCYLPPCRAHCGSGAGSLLNCRALPHGMCFWAGFCAGWQWHWTTAVGKS